MNTAMIMKLVTGAVLNVILIILIILMILAVLIVIAKINS